MPYHPKPSTLLRRWEEERADNPSLTVEQFAHNQFIPLTACLSRLDTARRERANKLKQITKAGAVTTIEFEVSEGWNQWLLLQSDNHHDSIY